MNSREALRRIAALQSRGQAEPGFRWQQDFEELCGGEPLKEVRRFLATLPSQVTLNRSPGRTMLPCLCADS